MVRRLIFVEDDDRGDIDDGPGRDGLGGEDAAAWIAKEEQMSGRVLLHGWRTVPAGREILDQ